MATPVQDNEIFATSWTSQTRVLNGVVAGNFLGASFTSGDISITVTIADNVGGTWSTISGVDPFTDTPNGLRGYIWSSANHPGGNTTITWTPSGTISGFVGCIEYSGLATVSPLQSADGESNTGTTDHLTQSLTRPEGGAIYSVVQATATTTWTAGSSPFTFTSLGTGGSARAFHQSAEPGSGNGSAQATSNANRTAIILAAAFKDAAGPPATRRVFVVS
jgi:hypothetical protein